MVHFRNASAGNAECATTIEHDSMPALELVLHVEQGIGTAAERLHPVVGLEIDALGISQMSLAMDGAIAIGSQLEHP